MDTCQLGVSLGSVWPTWWQLEPVCSHVYVVCVVAAVAISVTVTLGGGGSQHLFFGFI